MAFKVYIDPGHKGSTYNKSTTGLNYYESAAMWTLSLYLKEELEKRGVTVALSRNSINSNPSLYNRGYGAKGYDLFISMHSNATGNASVDYPIVYRGYDKTKADDFAKQMANLVHDVIGTKNAGKVGTRRNSSGGEYYGVLRGARAAGLTYYYIFEHSFHTNYNATKWLMSDANLRLLAQKEAELIVKYFVGKPTTTTSTSTNTSSASSNVSKVTINKFTPVKGSATDFANIVKNIKLALNIDYGLGFAINSTIDNILLTNLGNVVLSTSSYKPNITYALQQLLKWWGYNLSLDGTYGSGTRSTVALFQSQVGIAQTGTTTKEFWHKVLGK